MQSSGMIHSSVYIRSVEYLNSKDAALVGAFLSQKHKQIPVVYQYCQTKESNVTDNTHRIGHATNFRIENDIMVCDVYLNPLANHTTHFQNIIDNYTVNIVTRNNELVFDITRLIIYDKEFKANRDREIAENVKRMEMEQLNKEEN